MAGKQVIGGVQRVLKKTTGLTGMFVSQNPHYELKAVYTRILQALQTIPESAAYRRNTEKIVKERLAVVETESDVLKLEEKIGMGQAEELIVQAQYELNLVRTMAKYKPWEPLVAKEPEGQWRWPV